MRMHLHVRPRPRPIFLVKARTSPRGIRRPAVVSALYCAPGMLTTLPLAMSARLVDHFVDAQHIRSGIDDMSMPAR